jgi:hypothetical protein
MPNINLLNVLYGSLGGTFISLYTWWYANIFLYIKSYAIKKGWDQVDQDQDQDQE